MKISIERYQTDENGNVKVLKRAFIQSPQISIKLAVVNSRMFTGYVDCSLAFEPEGIYQIDIGGEPYINKTVYLYVLD